MLKVILIYFFDQVPIKKQFLTQTLHSVGRAVRSNFVEIFNVTDDSLEAQLSERHLGHDLVVLDKEGIRYRRCERRFVYIRNPRENMNNILATIDTLS